MKDLFCFIHIEKCAGTTLHHSINYNYPFYHILRPWYVWSNEPGNHLSKKEFKRLYSILPYTQGVGGHTVRTFLKYDRAIERNMKYFTFLRNPIDRYISHFNHQSNKNGNDFTLDYFLKEKRFNNYITTRIAGEENLDLAKKRLKEDFQFIGLSDHYDESVVMLSQLFFGRVKSLYYETKNERKSDRKISYYSLTETEKEIVCDNNSLDIMLYDFVIKDLYPKFKNKFEGNLDFETESFIEKNKTYKYNRIRYYTIKFFRLITERIIQKIIHKAA